MISTQKRKAASWREFPALQQPNWPDDSARDDALKTLSHLPPLVFAGECLALKRQLSEAVEGKAFVLQAGDCAEDFSRCTGPDIRELLKVILQMSVILAYAGEKRVIKIGRIAGQYAKPRSNDTEMVDGVAIPSYRGDMVNSLVPTVEARTPDPRRMVEGYFRAAATLNLIRSFTLGGYAALGHIKAWHKASLDTLPIGQKYQELSRQIWKIINFMSAIEIDAQLPQLNQAMLFTSHEALLLEYEQELTRVDSITGKLYDTSAHMLWIGDRTRQFGSAHVEFLRGVQNPLGLKIGPKHDIDEIKRVIERLNPENEAGRVTLITRFGADKIPAYLPQLLREINREGCKVVWCCDPMHGNSYVNKYGQKSRRFDDILQEIRFFNEIHKSEGTHPGGVHLELTGDNVTECTGGSRGLLDEHLRQNYQTSCDPRLNSEQSVELAFELAALLQPSDPQDDPPRADSS